MPADQYLHSLIPDLKFYSEHIIRHYGQLCAQYLNIFYLNGAKA